MPMRYADQEYVLTQLEIDASDTERVASVVDLENELAASFDAKVGRTWGTAAVAETREVTMSSASPRLIASTGIRDLISIETGGTWNGTAWQDGDVLTIADYRLTLLDQDGLYWGIDALAGSWSGTVRVTATWGDQPEALVPDDVRRAMNKLTIKEFRSDTSSPQEVVGPDDFQVVTPSGWNDPFVKDTIRLHIPKRLVV